MEKRGSTAAMIAVLVLVAGSLIVPERPSATAPAGGRQSATAGAGIPAGVAFNSMRDGNAEIYTMDWVGGRQARITHDPATDVDPAISPDGRQIVFTSSRSGNNDIFVVASGGAHARDDSAAGGRQPG